MKTCEHPGRRAWLQKLALVSRCLLLATQIRRPHRCVGRSTVEVALQCRQPQCCQWVSRGDTQKGISRSLPPRLLRGLSPAQAQSHLAGTHAHRNPFSKTTLIFTFGTSSPDCWPALATAQLRDCSLPVGGGCPPPRATCLAATGPRRPTVADVMQ